ncbi:putative membrane protein [Stella humosa]|uniref:Putative membrane protein n=1 Tax=Stella humosa TaxID=94 RepID=A0A3N1KWW1_9PROT|nr:periplasmic heavy metal sensor [Stella humosa]ROP83080.1 putative membrane protein [Stella humosa]BBK30144.1 hypothetical protein STHU_07780 [Stella humosa]
MSHTTGPDLTVNPPPAAARAGWRRWLLPAALLLSLAFNVFLGSALVGRFAHDQTRGDPTMLTGFRSFAEGLPANARETVRDSFRARRGEISRERRELREARQRVTQALAAEPFDAGAARRAFDSLRHANDGMARVTQEAVVEAAGKLPVELRREMQERRPRAPRERPPGDRLPVTGPGGPPHDGPPPGPRP